MKKAIALLLNLCLMLASFSLCAVAEAEQAEPTFDAHKVIVKTNTYIDPEKYANREDALFCGVIVNSVEFLDSSLTKEQAIEKLNKDGYIEYVVAPRHEQRLLYTLDYFKESDRVVDAGLYYKPFNTNESLFSKRGNELYAPFSVILTTSVPFDTGVYHDKTETSLFGVDVRDVECIYRIKDEETNEWRSCLYLVYLSPSISVYDAIEIFKTADTVKEAFPNEYVYIDEPSDPRTLGDIDANEIIDSMDYILLKRAYFGTYTLDYNAPIRADINKNDEIDSLDYLLLKRAYFGTYVIE